MGDIGIWEEWTEEKLQKRNRVRFSKPNSKYNQKHQIITRYNLLSDLLLDIIREQDKEQVKEHVVRREYCTWHYQSMWKT